MRYGALRIGDELNPQPIEAGEIGLRLRRNSYLLPSFEFGEQRSVRDADFDDCGVRAVSPEVLFFVSTGVFGQDLRCDLHFDGFFVGKLADPVLKARMAFVTNRLKQIGIRYQVRAE